MSRDTPPPGRKTRENPPPATDPTGIGPPPAGAEVARDGAVTSGLTADAATGRTTPRDGTPGGDPPGQRPSGNVSTPSGLGSDN